MARFYADGKFFLAEKGKGIQGGPPAPHQEAHDWEWDGEAGHWAGERGFRDESIRKE